MSILERIKPYLASEAMTKGKQIVNENRAVITKVDSFWRDEITIEGVIDGEITCFIEFKDDGVKRYDCKCHSKQICEHQYALCYIYEQKDRMRRYMNFSVKTSKSAMDLFHTTYNQVKTDGNGVHKGDVSHVRDIEVLVTEAYPEKKIMFRAGNEKFYYIKSLEQFVEAFQYQEIVSYGKNTSFAHDYSYLSKDGKRIFDFIIREQHRWGKNFIYLSEDIVDAFFELVKNEPFQMENKRGEFIWATFVEDDPSLTLVIKPYQLDGYQVDFRENYEFFKGNHTSYLWMNNVIYPCDKTYSATMKQLLISAKANQSRREQQITLNRSAFYYFLKDVLPEVRKGIVIDNSMINKDEFVLKEPTYQLIVAKTKKEVITCECIAHYQDGTKQGVGGGDRLYSVPYYRNYALENKIEQVIKNYGLFQEAMQLFVINPNVAFEFLTEGVEELKEYGEIILLDSFLEYAVEDMPEITARMSFLEDFLEVELDFGDLTENDLNDILTKYNNRQKIYELENGKRIRVSYKQYDTLRFLKQEEAFENSNSHQKTFQTNYFRTLFFNQLIKQKKSRDSSDEKMDAMIRDFENYKTLPYELPRALEGVLRPYQVEGFMWLKNLAKYHFGGILADEMGLGKTIQIIALLCSEQSAHTTTLIACPSSLVFNWSNEIANFAPQLNVAIVAGDMESRKNLLRDKTHYDVYITSYQLLANDYAHYKNREFTFFVLDEAQYIKNSQTRNAKVVKKINAKNRFALTGTPIENRLTELWSIFDFLMPGYLYSARTFKSQIENPIVKQNDSLISKRLRLLIAPFILRRLKHDVLEDLPPKLEEVVYSKFANEQSELYMATAHELKTKLEATSNLQYAKENIYVLAQLMKLRQICCDPTLCYMDYEGTSAKLETCMALIQRAIEGNHKIILFSQFTSMLAIIQKRLEEEHIDYYLLTGNTPKEERVKLVDNFNHNEIPIFLISLRAGGTGLNLVSADIVIHYDPWWNLSVQNQATDRTHRIGQKKLVTVYKLIAKHTIEENIVKLQESKRQLACEVLDGNEISFSKLSREELIDLLL